jgi:hypothetical protein
MAESPGFNLEAAKRVASATRRVEGMPRIDPGQQEAETFFRAAPLVHVLITTDYDSYRYNCQIIRRDAAQAADAAAAWLADDMILVEGPNRERLTKGWRYAARGYDFNAAAGKFLFVVVHPEETLLARITSDLGAGAAHGWIERMDLANGNSVDRAGGRSGTSTVDPAYSDGSTYDRRTVPENTIVRLYRAYAAPGRVTLSVFQDANGEDEHTIYHAVIEDASGGTFTLAVAGTTSGITDPIAYDASAADVLTALEALGITVEVTGAGTTGSPFAITFLDDFDPWGLADDPGGLQGRQEWKFASPGGIINTVTITGSVSSLVTGGADTVKVIPTADNLTIGDLDGVSTGRRVIIINAATDDDGFNLVIDGSGTDPFDSGLIRTVGGANITLPPGGMALFVGEAENPNFSWWGTMLGPAPPEDTSGLFTGTL